MSVPFMKAPSIGVKKGVREPLPHEGGRRWQVRSYISRYRLTRYGEVLGVIFDSDKNPVFANTCDGRGTAAHARIEHASPRFGIRLDQVFQKLYRFLSRMNLVLSSPLLTEKNHTFRIPEPMVYAAASCGKPYFMIIGPADRSDSFATVGGSWPHDGTVSNFSTTEHQNAFVAGQRAKTSGECTAGLRFMPNPFVFEPCRVTSHQKGSKRLSCKQNRGGVRDANTGAFPPESVKRNRGVPPAFRSSVGQIGTDEIDAGFGKSRHDFDTISEDAAGISHVRKWSTRR